MTIDSNSLLESIMASFNRLGHMKIEDIPNIDLYMDQVTTLMEEHLRQSTRYPDQDKILTKTMINNYTKNNLLPSPNKKKYSKEHMLLLIFIYYFKSFLSISDIQSIFGPLTEKFYGEGSSVNLEDIYKEVFSFEKNQMEHLVRDVINQYHQAEQTFTEVEKEEDREFLVIFSFICLLSFDVYVKKMIIEHLIDNRLKPGQSKKESERKEK